MTDPDSGNMKTPRGHMQGYNAQAASNEQQIVLAAEVTVVAPDFGVLEPMVTATLRRARAQRGSPSGRGGRSPTPATGISADGARHQPGDPGSDPARRRQPQAPAGLGRRPLRAHAPRSRDRPRRRALQTKSRR